MSGPKDDVQKRLEKVRAERAALAAKAPTEEELALAELEAEELALANEKAIAAAVEKHGKVGVHLGVVETRLGVVVLKRPHAATFKRFMDGGETSYAAFDQLVRPCVVHPDTARLDQILDELPATLTLCADAVVTLAGMKRKEVSGKS